MAQKEYPNVKVLEGFRMNGEHVGAGAVISKAAFEQKADWQNLVGMTPPVLEETDAKLRRADEPEAPVLPGM